MKKILLSGIAFLFMGSLSAQNVNIPDANFKAYLVGNTSINTNSDAEIQVAEAAAFSGAINCSNLSISSLTGIEAFTALTNLSCNSNSLSSLDLSANTALNGLYCQSNNLTSLILSNNASLTYLFCYSNSLTSLDLSSCTDLIGLRCYSNSLTSINISNSVALTTLRCYSNSLTSLDVSANVNLTDLRCASNSLTSLDVTNNTVLSNLNCHSNSLTSLDLSNNTALDELVCLSNNLTSLDLSNNTALAWLECGSNNLISLDLNNNTALTRLECDSNSLQSLDLSNNTILDGIFCSSNSLTSLDVSNGNNINITGAKFDATNNPNLNCIKVDSVPYSIANWMNIDPASTFKEDTTGCVVTTGIDFSEHNRTQNLSLYPNPTNGQFSIDLGDVFKQSNIQILDVSGRVVYEEITENKQIVHLNFEAPKGIYFVRINTEQTQSTIKLIKQ